MTIWYTWDQIIDKGYIVAHHKVYDPGFLTNHPGGNDMIIKKLGTDCTHDYDMHNKKGKLLWKTYIMGKITSSELKKLILVKK